MRVMRVMGIVYGICLGCLLASGVGVAQEAEYGRLSRTYVLHGDGSQEERCYKELTLFTHTAMRNEYGETFIVYNPDAQELKIHSAYTRQKDGTIVEAPENAFVEVLPRQAAGAPAYNRLREMVVVHTGLEIGATIYLDYSIYTKAGYLATLDVCEIVAQSSPVKEYTLTVSLPADRSLRYTLYNVSARPKEREVGGQKEITWRITGLPSLSREAGVSALAGDVGVLAVSGYASASAALEVLGKQLTAKGDQPVLSLAETLTEGKVSETEKLRAILRHVVHHVGSSRLTLRETGYRIRRSDDVMATAYGTEAEKVNLLAALLTEAGLEAEVVASFPASIDMKYCGLSAVNELFVLATADGKTYWLSGTSDRMSEGGRFFAYKRYFSVSRGKEIALTSLTAPSYGIDWRYEIEVTAEEAEIRQSGSVGDALLSYLDGEKSDTIESSQSLSNHDGYVALSLPDAPQGVGHTAYVSYNSRRTSNLLLPGLFNEVYHYMVSLPDGMALVTPTGEQRIDNGCGHTTFAIKQEGRRVEVVRTFAITKQMITPSDYAAFRRLITEWADVNNRRLLLKAGD